MPLIVGGVTNRYKCPNCTAYKSQNASDDPTQRVLGIIAILAALTVIGLIIAFPIWAWGHVDAQDNKERVCIVCGHRWLAKERLSK